MIDNPFLLHPQQLQKYWKDLRKSISDNSADLAKLNAVSEFWNRAPISSPYLDYLNTATWPDAWSLVDTKLLDTNTLALGMFYTLLLSDDKVWTANRLMLAMLRNKKESWERLVCVVDGRWLLNYDRDQIIDGYEIADMCFMHMYKYNLHVRGFYEIDSSQLKLHYA